MAAPLYVFSRSGTLEQTIPLSYGVNALGGDDAADDPAGYTVAVTSGAVSQGSNFGSHVPQGEIQGTLWNDVNGNGVQDPGELPLVGRMVYLDTNGDGHWDTGEPYAMTDANGNYTITGVTPGTYSVQEALPSGWEQTSPSLGSAPRRLFALANDGSGKIVELDPANGLELNRFATPDGSSYGGLLAYDGASLFYLNQNELWQLNPATGAVLRSDQIEVGGGFQGMAALDGELYLLSSNNQSVVEFDPHMRLATQVLTLSWPSLNEEPMFGSGSQGGDLTAITSPDELLATGGWADPTSGQWEGGVLQIDPATGVVSPLFAYPAAVHPNPQSLAVVEGSIYAGVNWGTSGMAAPLYVFSRSGTLEQTIPLSYGVECVGGDDAADDPAGYTVAVTSGAVSQGSNFGSQAATTTVVTSSNGSSTYDQPVTFTATVTPYSGSGPTGTVQFQIDGSNVGSPVTLSNGTASYTTPILADGSHSIVAVYSGDTNFMPSTSPGFNFTYDTTPPTVTNVLVRGTGWAPAFPSYNGYFIPVGGGSQLVTLPG